jgi:aminotransferase
METFSQTQSSIPIQPAVRMQGLPTQFFANLVRKAGEQIALGHDVINLGQGNPDQPTPAHIVQAMQEASANPAYHRYPPFSGFPFLKEAISRRYKEDYNVDLDPETEVWRLRAPKWSSCHLKKKIAFCRITLRLRHLMWTGPN